MQPQPQTTPDSTQSSEGKPLTLVLGATTRTDRYAYLATQRLLQHGHPVLLVGRQGGTVLDQPIHTDLGQVSGPMHTITLYLSAANQTPLIPAILALRPARIIFNPGAEHPELAQLAATQGIECLEACTLVMLGSGQY